MTAFNTARSRIGSRDPCISVMVIAATLLLIPNLAWADTHDIALDMSAARPAVLVRIGLGAPELWIFDTGASGTVMNIDHARALGLHEEQPVRVGSPAGGTPLEGFLTTLEGARIGGMALPALHVVAAPLTLPNGRGGVISPTAFRGQLVTYDFAHAVAHISDKEPATIPHEPASSYNQLPTLAVALGAQNWSAHMDTGSNGGLTLPYSLAASLPLSAPPIEDGVAHFQDGDHPRYRAQIAGHVQVGPLSLDNPEVAFIDGLPNVNLGMQLLSKMIITLDPEEQREWVQAAPR